MPMRAFRADRAWAASDAVGDEQPSYLNPMFGQLRVLRKGSLPIEPKACRDTETKLLL